MDRASFLLPIQRRAGGSLHALCRAALLLAALLPPAAHAQGQMVCVNGGEDCKVVVPERHAVTKLDYWQPAFAKPVEQRIGPASAELIDYLVQDNVRNSIPNRPRIPVLAPDFLRDVQQAFDELPAAVKRLLSRKLAGISFAEDFGGTGFTEEIVDSDSKPVAGFVVLDPVVLSGRTANAWATWKENTPFKQQPGYELVAQIEAQTGDNRKNAIQYILLHELGHVLAIGEKIHPRWTIEPKEVRSAAGFPYFLLSWALPKEGDGYPTLFDATFPERKDVVYYFGAKLPGERMIGVYNTLATTNFPTLYAATNPADDWAEAFVTYVHTVLMKKPFGIRIYTEGKLTLQYQSCWAEKRCGEKRRILERFLDAGCSAGPRASARCGKSGISSEDICEKPHLDGICSTVATHLTTID